MRVGFGDIKYKDYFENMYKGIDNNIKLILLSTTIIFPKLIQHNTVNNIDIKDKIFFFILKVI